MGEMSESFQAAQAWRETRPEACKHFKQTDEQTQTPSGSLPVPHRQHQRGVRRGQTNTSTALENSYDSQNSTLLAKWTDLNQKWTDRQT